MIKSKRQTKLPTIRLSKKNETKPVSENEHMSTIGQMKDSNDGLLLQCKRLQLFQCPVKDVQIHLFFRYRAQCLHRCAAKSATCPHSARNLHNNGLSNKDKH